MYNINTAALPLPSRERGFRLVACKQQRLLQCGFNTWQRDGWGKGKAPLEQSCHIASGEFPQMDMWNKPITVFEKCNLPCKMQQQQKQQQKQAKAFVWNATSTTSGHV